MNKIEDVLNISKVLKMTPNRDKLKVTLKKLPMKGTGVIATQPIKKGNIIAYYKIKLYNMNDSGPFGSKYLFTVYTKNGNPSKKYIGNLSLESVPNPYRNIPYWGYFTNETTTTQLPNAYMDMNIKGNYTNRDVLKEGDYYIYKLIASKNIAVGEEICWCYGESYPRDYPTSCNL
jgi:hypothetical protein